MKHCISINDFTKKEIFDEIIPGCRAMIAQARERKTIKPQPEKKAIFAFFEPSTRTRGSYLEASRLLGWTNAEISGTEATSLTKKESIANTVRMFAAQGADVLVMRSKIEGAQRFASEILDSEGYEVSVQNGGDGTNQHPSQTFLDLLTISEKLGRLDRFKIGFFGDLKYGRTVHSLLCALAHRKNISLTLFSAPETALQTQYKQLFTDVKEVHSIDKLGDCDIIYGSRLQEERFTGDPVALGRTREKFRITSEILDSFRKNILIMHPMPYVQEFDPRIRKDIRLIIDLQAWHGIPTRMHLLSEGYRNRKAKTLPTAKKDAEFKIIKEIALKDYLEQRKKKKTASRYFLPITNGTVIDHIPHGLGLKIREFLSAKDILVKGVKHTIEDVSSKKCKLKDVLVLENIFIPDSLVGTIASFAPDITFNTIKDGIFKKIKVKTTDKTAGIGVCPNQNCITNHDPEAAARFTHINGGLRCHYCEKDFTQKEVI
ncbi:MAG: aspartate carbamoyltransferase regulatory subunit [Candidatus Falkowbacteria bacterium]